MMGTTTKRTGFSMVELLVVIAIIAVLMALGIGVIRAVLESQQQANTEATMRTIDKVLQQHWNYVVGEARKESPSDNVNTLAGSDARRAKAIWTKLRLIEAFPEKYDEVLPAGGTAPGWQKYLAGRPGKYTATYARTLKSAGATVPTSTSPAVQSSTLVVLALSVRRGGPALDATELGPALKDTDGDGLKEVVDGWGQPIRFVRFPTTAKNTANPDLSELQGKNPARPGSKESSFCDPLDPDGLLLNPSWYAGSYTSLLSPAITTAGGEFEQLFHPVYFQTTPTRVANYIVPVLSSEGPQANVDDDDIHSFNVTK
jgi:prepilin-type N-terminal cleavage/methylation domain-containing protein